MRKWPLLLWLLAKRLYKKPAFLALLLLIPLLAIGYRLSLTDAGGLVTVGLVQEAPDPLGEQIIQELTGEDSLIRYEVFPSAEAARQQLSAGKIHAVWVFPDDLQEKIEKYAADPVRENACITVWERTDNVALSLTREKLGSKVYPQIAQTVYLQYLRTYVPELAHLSDDALLEYYHNTAFSAELFTFGEAERTPEQENFLLSPLRGILGVLIALCGVAAAMYYLQDRQKGTFTWCRSRLLPELSCLLVAVVQLGIVALVCLMVCRLSPNLLLELATLALYSLCVTAFSMLIGRLFPSIKALAVAFPVLAVVMLVVCPVFFDLGKLRIVQYLLPPTYYINAVYQPAYLGYMALYTAACFGIRWVIMKLKKV